MWHQAVNTLPTYLFESLLNLTINKTTHTYLKYIIMLIVIIFIENVVCTYLSLVIMIIISIDTGSGKLIHVLEIGIQ